MRLRPVALRCFDDALAEIHQKVGPISARGPGQRLLERPPSESCNGQRADRPTLASFIFRRSQHLLANSGLPNISGTDPEPTRGNPGSDQRRAKRRKLLHLPSHGIGDGFGGENISAPNLGILERLAGPEGRNGVVISSSPGQQPNGTGNIFATPSNSTTRPENLNEVCYPPGTLHGDVNAGSPFERASVDSSQPLILAEPPITANPWQPTRRMVRADALGDGSEEHSSEHELDDAWNGANFDWNEEIERWFRDSPNGSVED